VWHCLCDPMFSHFSRTLTCDRQTDRQKGRHMTPAYTALAWHCVVKIRLWIVKTSYNVHAKYCLQTTHKYFTISKSWDILRHWELTKAIKRLQVYNVFIFYYWILKVRHLTVGTVRKLLMVCFQAVLISPLPRSSTLPYLVVWLFLC